MSISQANPAFSLDLSIVLDRSQPRGLRAQLEHALRAALRSGRLGPGARLPPSRVLAGELGVARSVVVDAYGQLVADGYLEARQGSGTRVRAHFTIPERMSAGPEVRFRSGYPDPGTFPRREWLRHYRATITSQPDASFHYPYPEGTLELRRALAHYLGRVRAIAASPEQVMIFTGFSQALAVLSRALRRRGHTRIAVEDPGFSYHRRIVAAAGLEPVPIPVDDGGMDVGRLWDLHVSAVLLAPAHSYPSCAVLSSDRRIELLDWAQSSDGIIVEDDYDGLLRYDGLPLGALQGLAPERVVYGGTATKVLAGALRLGWLVLPSRLAKDVVREKFFDDLASEALSQLALARLIEAGDLSRHLRRVRPLYRRRREAAVRAITRYLPEAEAVGVSAGLHLFVRLPAGCDEEKLVDTAAELGFDVEGGARHWADRGSAPPTLLLGYASLSESELERGIATLGTAYALTNGTIPPTAAAVSRQPVRL